MTAICYNCASDKGTAMQPCPTCGARPTTENDIAVSLILTSETMSPTELQNAAKSILGGQRITLEPHKRQFILEVLGSTIGQEQVGGRHAPRKASSSEPGRWAIFIGGLALLAVIFTPWPQYWLAKALDTVSAYQIFTGRFPHSKYTPMAQDRIRVLRDDEVWTQASESGELRMLREYRNTYPDGNHLAEAKVQIEDLADQQWPLHVNSRSDEGIRKFLKDYPETTWRAEAEERILTLYSDIAWVKEQDKLEHYRRFLESHPAHAEKSFIEKRIIDLEVKAIAAGDYGQLPPAQALGLGGSTAQVEIANDTGYELTVRYSGPDSQKIVVPKGGNKSLSLPPGTYQVAASVSASNVRNYYGKDAMLGGRYSSKFYIKTNSPSDGFNIPGRSSLSPAEFLK